MIPPSRESYGPSPHFTMRPKPAQVFARLAEVICFIAPGHAGPPIWRFPYVPAMLSIPKYGWDGHTKAKEKHRQTQPNAQPTRRIKTTGKSSLSTPRSSDRLESRHRSCISACEQHRCNPPLSPPDSSRLTCMPQLVACRGTVGEDRSPTDPRHHLHQYRRDPA